MAEFLIYQGKAAIALAVFYMFYRLLLSKETFHCFNRIVLLGTAALSFVLPLCVITIHEVVTIPAVQSTPQVFESATSETTAVAEVSEPIWPHVLCVIFAIGAFGVLAMTIISIIKVIGIIASGANRTLESGETLVITDETIAPFSWMKYIVISREDFESGYSQIMTHEKAHIALRHSWDILFVDMITALQWFNPAIWMLKADLRAIHEFEADDAVLRSGTDVKEYQYLLIRKAVSKSGYSVANSFNHSTLKARITMMSNKKSSRTSAWKALYVIPLVGISLAATAETKVDYQYEPQEPLKARVVEVHDTTDVKVEEEKPVRFIPVSEGVGDLAGYTEFKLYSDGVFGKVISRKEYESIPNDALAYLYVQHLDNGKKSLHVYTLDYNSIVHLRKCRKTTDINDEKLAGVNEETVILVDGKWTNFEGYQRTLKFQSDKIKEIEYCLKKDKISMISVIFDREYNDEEYTIRN